MKPSIYNFDHIVNLIDFKEKSQQKCDFWRRHKTCVEMVKREFNSRVDMCGCTQACSERILQKSGKHKRNMVRNLKFVCVCVCLCLCGHVCGVCVVMCVVCVCVGMCVVCVSVCGHVCGVCVWACVCVCGVCVWACV